MSSPLGNTYYHDKAHELPSSTYTVYIRLFVSSSRSTLSLKILRILVITICASNSDTMGSDYAQ